jgi:glycerol-3-phosphate dehydrogenase
VENKPILETQVLIIGGGISGIAIARDLSRYKVDAIVVEKEMDIAGGQTKCNSGMIYSTQGLTWAGSLMIKSVMDVPGATLLHPDSLKEKLTLKGFAAFPALAQELDITSFKKRNYMMIAISEEEIKPLRDCEEVCRQIGFQPEKLDHDAVLALEPHVNPKVICGLLDTRYETSVYSWESCIALAENAQENGVRILTGAGVKAIRPYNGGFLVDTARGAIHTEFVVNAAGAFADEVARMAGVCDFGLSFVPSQMEILDKRFKGLIRDSVGPPCIPGRGGKISALPSGNISLGFGDYLPTTEREVTPKKQELTEFSIARACELVPGISSRDIIKSFTGVRVFNTRDPEDHIIEATAKYPHFIQAVIRLPSLAASPAIAEYVVDLLGNQGLALVRKTDFNPRRQSIPKVSELSDADRQKLIALDPRYGHIVCRCEEISEGEIVEAIRRGARTVDGVKYRTRAGMGRCQGGFCGPRVTEILARELDIPMTQITQFGGLSRILLYRSKELLC